MTENVGEIRKRYQPLRERTEELLRQSGIPEGTPEYRKARKNFTKEAYSKGIDEVTKLPVRSLFETRLQEELDRAERNRTPLTLMIVDLNNLKEINKGGLPAGDKALRTVAEKIITSIRRTDYVARYGGDEFAVLLPGATEADVNGVWERFTIGMEGFPYTATASAMQINRGNVEAARTKISEKLKSTKDQTNHDTNAFEMAA